jgi:hypothetical protein
MMTRWFLILWSFFFSVMTPVPSTGEEISTLTKKVSPSVITILTYGQERRRKEVAEMIYPKGLPFLWKEEYKKAFFYSPSL